MKQKIITCARDIYLEDGYNGFSMRKIAQCVGISATAIYRHFSDKEDLLFSVLLTGFREFSKYLKRCESEPTPIERLLRSAYEYMNFALEHPAYYEMMFITTDQIAGLKGLNQKGADEMEATYLYHHQLVEDCQFKNQDVDQLSLAMWAFSHGFASLFLAGKLPLTQEEFLDIYQIQVKNYMEQQK